MGKLRRGIRSTQSFSPFLAEQVRQFLSSPFLRRTAERHYAGRACRRHHRTSIRYRSGKGKALRRASRIQDGKRFRNRLPRQTYRRRRRSSRLKLRPPQTTFADGVPSIYAVLLPKRNGERKSQRGARRSRPVSRRTSVLHWCWYSPPCSGAPPDIGLTCNFRLLSSPCEWKNCPARFSSGGRQSRREERILLLSVSMMGKPCRSRNNKRLQARFRLIRHRTMSRLS